VDVKKELLLTSLLAISLAVGLGALSFGLFSQAPPNVQIDVSAKKNGAPSLSFLPLDQVLIEAHVSSNNAPVVGTPVDFEVESPNGTDFHPPVQTVRTDSRGIANITFQIPWPSILTSQSIWELGTWQTNATAKVNGQALHATTNYTCETLKPTIDLYTEKGGRGPNAPGGTFTTNETVLVYVEVRNELNQTVPNWQIGFEALISTNGGANYTTYTFYSQVTNASGIATIHGTINPTIAAEYEDIATTSYEDMRLADSMTIIVQLSG
jgi:hypothetical protein